MRKWIFIIFSLIFQVSYSQKICFSFLGDSIKLDSQLIAINSISVYCSNKKINYKFLAEKNLLIIKDKISDSIKVCFYRFKQIKKEYHYLDTSLILPIHRKNNKIIENQHIFNIEENQNKIQTEGYIIRNVSVGSNQDLVLDSKLNLKVEGDITDSLKIKANIRDDNIPIQPDGTTTTLAELGQIYVKIYDNKKTFFLGDMHIKNSFGYFSKFEKTLKGVYFSWEKNKTYLKIGTSLTKGIYKRQIIQGIEGNQGPYKLQGKYNETFILVVAGSEKVYVDGQLKKRGIDYKIDYNTAELYFTANCPITKQTRIIVEFEYSQKFYPNYFNFFESGYKTGNWEFQFSNYHQSDSRSNPYFPLTEQQKIYLYKSGDSLNIFIPIFDSVKTLKNKILYQKKDTIVNGKKYEIFVYSTDTAEVLYDVKFIYVGKNKGDYILAKTGINGKIYRWISPKNNIKQGEYMPSSSVKPPQKKMISTFISSYTDKRFSFRTETTISNYDKNTFSPYDDNDNIGFAQKIDITQNIQNQTFTADWQFVNKNFSSFDFYKEAEFERNWNYYDFQKINENFLTLGWNYKISDTSETNIKIQILQNSKGFLGYKPILKTNFLLKSFSIKLNFENLFSQYKQTKTNFLKYDVKISKKLKKFTTTIFTHSEKNSIYWQDTLNNQSFFYQNIGFQLQTNDSLVKFNYFRQINFIAQNKFKLSDFSDNFELKFKFSNKKIQISSNSIYRKLNYKSSDSTSKNLFGNDTYFNLRYKGINFSLKNNYFLGKQQKQQIVFVEVEAGKGQYKWIDYNKNGVQEINEFEIAQYPDEAKFIKLQMQTNQYISTSNNNTSLNILFTPYLYINNDNFWKNFLKPLSNSLIINQIIKTETNTHKPIYELKNLANRISVKLGKFTLNYNYSEKKTQQTFIYGTDILWQYGNNISLTFENKLYENQISIFKKIDGSKSEFFENKNFRYETVGIENKFEIKKLKINFLNSYQIKYSPNIRLKVIKLQIIWDFRIKKFSAQSTLQFINNSIKGNQSINPQIYQMLEGNQIGKNYIFQITINKMIYKNLQNNLTLQIRKTSEKVITNGLIGIQLIF